MRLRTSLSVPLFFLVLALPASTNYEMHDFGFGSGGTDISESSNYGLTGITGEVAGQNLSGSTYDMGPGLQFVRQSHTPAAPTLTNAGTDYNKLNFVVNTGNNPSDTLFAIAISSDGFTTTNYVQTDNTVGSTPAYQTYAAWGGATGESIVGLAYNTTYAIKVRAVQTKYTESAFSLPASAATTTPSLAYDIDVSASDSETAAPYQISFGPLNIGSVTTATEKIWIDLDTNAASGAFVYVTANSNGLTSVSTGNTILSSSSDLSSSSEGFGLQVATTAQSSGSLAAAAPYSSNNQVVGVLDTTSRTIFTTNNQPLVNGRASVLVKAKASASTPAAADYAAIITMIASATF